MHSKLRILLQHLGQRLMRTFHFTKSVFFHFSLFLSDLVHPAHNYSQKKRRKKGGITLLPLRNPEKTGCLLDCLDAKRLPEVQRAPGIGPALLLKFSTSFVETQSKVTEVLAFVESISQGPIRLREPEPKSQTHLWAAGQALLLIMEKVRHGFDCAHIISAKLMIRDEKKMRLL